MLTKHLIYAAMWLLFGLGHSLLARERVKARLSFIPAYRYRLLYNAFAFGHTLLVLAVGRYLYAGQGGFFADSLWPVVGHAISIAGVILAVFALREYDLGHFAGTKQWRAGEAVADASQESVLALDGLHQYVRHPLYSAALLFLWGQATSWYGLMTALFGSAYLIIGTRFEEQALVETFGEQYRQYQKTVPAFFPGLRGSAARR